MNTMLVLATALKLAAPFTDHAVLQRDLPVTIAGEGEPGAAVAVEFAGNSVSGTIAADGNWRVTLPAMAASKTPRELTVRSDKESVTISDILVGEVWLASGQSNMEMPLWHPTRKRFRDKMGALMLQFCSNDNLRVVMTYPERGVSATPRKDYPIQWVRPTPEFLKKSKFSALAWYFGREVEATLDVPVGVMAAFWGGTMIGPWVPDCGWESVKDDPYVATNILANVAKRRSFEKENKRRGWPGYPGDLWNEMVAPFAPYTARGMIWYQGESNIDENRDFAYSKNMRALLDGWRKEFGCPDLKILYVELAPFSLPWLKLPLNDERLAKLCDEQERFAREEKDAYLAHIGDVGDVNDIHPCRKLEVGIRLAALAYQHVYGLPVKADAPIAKSAKMVAPGEVEIELEHGEGLYRWMQEVSLWTERQEESSPIRFIDENGLIADCKSWISNGCIRATSALVKNPKFVTHKRRCTDESNFFNASGLPLGTFKLAVEGFKPYQPSAGNLANRRAFADRRFGIFLHWGLYALLGQGEWYQHNANIDRTEYAKLKGAFNPAAFDAREWAKAFKRSGAKYVTFTTRHHEGFSMFATKENDYNVMNTPFKRDILKELADALAAEGIVLNLYYSLVDWHLDEYPLGDCKNTKGWKKEKANYSAYEQFMKRQISELMSGRYGKVGAIWFDGEWDHSPKTNFDWNFNDVYRHIHAIDPDCLVGNNHHHGLFEGEDIQLIENELREGQTIDARFPLETCETMNGNWGYAIGDLNYKSAADLIRLLAKNAGRSANFLVNIGPQPDGRLPAAALERLEAVGAWLKENGESIYGTESGPVAIKDKVVSTKKGETLYLHVIDPKLTKIEVKPGFVVKSVKELASGKSVTFRQNQDGLLTIDLKVSTDAADWVLKLF